MPRRYVSGANALLQSRLGAAIKARRKVLGITQEELAWRADMHRTYIADIERGVRNITLRSAGLLAEALKTPIASLLAYPGEPRPAVEEGPETFGAASNAQGWGEILFVEDNPEDVEMALHLFRQGGLINPVKVVPDGQDALDYIYGTGAHEARQNEPLPQLILLDLHLPKLGGIEVLRRVKSDPRTRDIAVVVLTVSRRDWDVSECRRLGATQYITKPLTFESLSRVASKLNLRWALLPADASVAVGGA